MTEPFGVAAGGVGIAAIFSTCVESFDHIQIGRRFGKDFQTELLTISLLKVRLSRWGEAVNVYDDPQLSHPEAQRSDLDLAKNTLYHILVLLADSQAVSNKFRLEANPGEDLSKFTCADMNPTIGAVDSRMRKLAARRQKGASLVKLASWALYHKKHYSSLVGDVAKLLESLERMFPAPERQKKLADAEVEEISQGAKDQQAFIIKLIRDLGAEMNNVSKTSSIDVENKRGLSIGSQYFSDNARVRNGDYVTLGWKGESQLPTGNGRITIGSLHAGGNARVLNGTIFAGSDQDDFWN